MTTEQLVDGTITFSLSVLILASVWSAILLIGGDDALLFGRNIIHFQWFDAHQNAPDLGHN